MLVTPRHLRSVVQPWRRTCNVQTGNLYITYKAYIGFVGGVGRPWSTRPEAKAPTGS